MNHSTSSSSADYPMYVHVEDIDNPDLDSIPDLTRFQGLAAGETVKSSYAIRFRKPKFPWAMFLLLIWTIVIPVLLAVWFFVGSNRGHTFLYLTNRRIVIVELDQGFLGRSQTVLNYNLDDIAGFKVYTQNGLWRLFDVITLREQRAFYISLLTGSSASFTLGAVKSIRSDFYPGRDSVTLCSELDSTVLAIKAGTSLSGGSA